MKSKIGCVAGVGAAALAVGLSLAGAGMAAADSASEDSPVTAAGQTRGSGRQHSPTRVRPMSRAATVFGATRTEATPLRSATGAASDNPALPGAASRSGVRARLSSAPTPTQVRATEPSPVLTPLRMVSAARSGQDPKVPVTASWNWGMLAASSRETIAKTIPAANGWNSTAATVVAIPQTPLFTALRLQEIPVLGPLVVTPVVTVVNRIPIVGDLLHPIFGYPLLPDGLVAPRDVRVVAFDGAKINVHVLPAAHLVDGQAAPTVLWGSPIGMPGPTSLNGTPVDPLFTDFGGLISVAALRQAGYNVATWDSRGEFRSGGLLQADSPQFEARDVSSIISWIATLPEVQLDSPGDPRVGMVGASYGGSIQPVTAATDHRVDAIVPALAWNTLNTAYFPNNAFKSAQTFGLASAVVLTLTRTNPRILAAMLFGALTGRMTPASQDFFAERGPGSARGYPDLVTDITAPTLLIQGTVDPAFSLAEADVTATTLLGQGVPTKVIWFCGGHGLCINNLFDPAEGALIEQRTLAWLDRYVQQKAVSTGPGFEWFDQTGEHLSTETYPAPRGEPITASDNTIHVLPLIPFVGGSGGPLMATKALNAVDLRTQAATTTTYIAGAPRLTLSYSGAGVGGHVYAQLVDNTNSSIIGNQATPIPVTLDGEAHTVSIPLQPVAHTLRSGDTVTLQLFAWSSDYAANPALGWLKVTSMEFSLPTPIDVTVGPAASAPTPRLAFG